MSDTIPNQVSEPPLLEQLGALCSLLIHDLANQLCIISGSATFAQMTLGDRERLVTSLNAIVKAGEIAGHALASCGELRRALPDTVATGQVPEIVTELRAWADREGWSFEGDPADGAIRLPASWVTFTVTSVVKEVRAKSGTIRLTRVEDTTSSLIDLSETQSPLAPQFQIRLDIDYASEQPLLVKETRVRYEHLGLLAAFELNRCVGGRIDTRTVAPGQQEVQVYIPYVPGPA
jgi:hypothetical protein